MSREYIAGRRGVGGQKGQGGEGRPIIALHKLLPGIPVRGSLFCL